MREQNALPDFFAGLFAGRKILVVGDAILDRYWFGRMERLSREAPVPILVDKTETHRCGGAANVAANVVALGSQATLVVPCGDDPEGSILRRCCAQTGCNLEFISDPAGTTTKLRILAQGQQLLRVDSGVAERSAVAAQATAARAIALLAGHDAVVLSDYGLGALAAAASITAAAEVPVLVDPRWNWERYRKATLVCPNEEELAATGREVDELLSVHGLGAILLTQGGAGMTLHRPGRPAEQIPTRQVPVYDVTGAGDTVIAVMALACAAGLDWAAGARWANIAAGIVIGKMGAATVSWEELVIMPTGRGGRVVAAAELVQLCAVARSAKKKVVMTNGCFDILHAGHLASLSEAARLGNVLVVAVNDDKSVASLKGAGRPVVPLAQRVQVLAGLGCVDYVCSFAGPDAADLVRRLAPDFYVKGGDWQDKQPPEARATEAGGGKVVYLPVRTGLSTTNIVRKIKG